MRSRFLPVIPVVTLVVLGATPAIASTDLCSVAGSTLQIAVPTSGDVEIEAQDGALVVSSWDPDVTCGASPVAVGAGGVTALAVTGRRGSEAVTITTSDHTALLGLTSMSFALGKGIYDAVVFLGTPEDDAIDASTGMTYAGVELLYLEGDAGDDALVGSPLGDLLEGDDGADTMIGGAGDDYLVGGPGDDLMDGGDGIDVADLNGGASGVTADLGLGVAESIETGHDTLVAMEGLVGSEADDVLVGSSASDVLQGRGGDDVISGGGGSDRIEAGIGDDVVDGQGGSDVVEGSYGDDVLAGGPGGDSLIGGEGIDTVDGGVGRDRCEGEVLTACP